MGLGRKPSSPRLWPALIVGRIKIKLNRMGSIKREKKCMMKIQKSDGDHFHNRKCSKASGTDKNRECIKSKERREY